MTVLTALKSLAVLAVAGFIIAFAYVSYRNALTPRSIDLATIGTSAQQNVNAPVVCQASWSEFNTAGTVVVHIDQGAYRMDVTYVNQGSRIAFHIAGDAQNEYAWSDTGAGVRADDLALPDIPALHQAPCKAWWNADDSLLKPPASANQVRGL